MSHTAHRSCSQKAILMTLPAALAGSLCLAFMAQAQVHTDRTRPTQPAPPPAAPAPAPRTSTPAPTASPSRSSDSRSGPDRISGPPARVSGSGKVADFDTLFGGSKPTSGERPAGTSRSGESQDARTRPTGPSRIGTTVSGAQNGAAYDRFQRSLEGALYRNPPAASVIFAPSYPYYGGYNPYGGPYSDPYPYPGYPIPGPFPPYPPYPSPRVPAPDDRSNPDDYRIGEQEKTVDPLVEKAAQDLRAAWLNSDIKLLSKHIRRDIEIKIYTAHKLQKTLDASDFLSDTRYAFDTKTIQFQINDIHLLARHVYKVVTRQTTQDAQGFEHTITVQFILERMDGVYILTEVDTDD